jgi:hypothetical protein
VFFSANDACAVASHVDPYRANRVQNRTLSPCTFYEKCEAKFSKKFQMQSGILHGYFRDANGVLHFPIDPSGSTGTVLFGLNERNWVVGRYADSSGVTHGLFFVPPNNFFTFDYPGSTFTSLNGINAQGFICGRYTDASGIAHGFLARVRGIPPTNEAGTEMKAYNSPSLVTPLNPSPSAWGGAIPAR